MRQRFSKHFVRYAMLILVAVLVLPYASDGRETLAGKPQAAAIASTSNQESNRAGDLMVMWNNVESTSNWPRMPLSVAFSKDEGETWGHYHDIDSRPERDAAYPFVFFQDDEAVVTYYTRPTAWARDTEVMMRIYKVEQFYR